MKNPLVSIVVPCLNEAGYIEGCLRTLQQQDYPRDSIEVLLADGGSTDGTQDIVRRIAANDQRIRILHNARRFQAPGLNEAIKVSTGKIIVRMDVHCEYAANYVSKCVETLIRTGADNVGGAQRAIAKTPFQEVLCRVLTSPLGVGGAKYRSASEEGFVDTVFLGAFRRTVFENWGLYDDDAITNEDAELNQRILSGGGKIYLSREIVVHYYPRDSFSGLARQYYRYGLGRARTLRKHGKLPTVRPVLPFLLTVGLGSVILIPVLHPVALPILSGYFGLTGVEATRVAWDLGPMSVMRAWGMFPAIHFAHGLGFAHGLFRGARSERLGQVAKLRAPDGEEHPPEVIEESDEGAAGKTRSETQEFSERR
jgi:glycosyltransferase involved in cell wall biosynthesis